MEWRDEGILLWVRRHGESNVIIDALTERHGRHAGLVRGGASQSMSATLQPGAQLSLEWKARLVEHLGVYKTDLIRSRAGAIMGNRVALAALNAVSALLVQFLPEREPNEEVYDSTLSLMDKLGTGDASWPERYAIWELELLQALGYGLDLGSCASTGQTEDLVYVSPRSGRAVCRSAGGPFADRMLPLPAFLLGRAQWTIADVREAIRMTGYFLENWVCKAFDVNEMPEARMRLMRLMQKYEMPDPQPGRPETQYNAEEKAWLAQFK